MKYLDLTAEQSAQLAAGQAVEVWERMEPQPEHGHEVIDCHHSRTGFALAKIGGMCLCSAANIPTPNPPGTRAIATQRFAVGRYGYDIAKDIRVVSTTTRPEQRDGAWGFVTGWVKA